MDHLVPVEDLHSREAVTAVWVPKITQLCGVMKRSPALVPLHYPLPFKPSCGVDPNQEREQQACLVQRPLFPNPVCWSKSSALFEFHLKNENDNNTECSGRAGRIEQGEEDDENTKSRIKKLFIYFKIMGLRKELRSLIIT